MTDPFDHDAGRLEAALARWVADRELANPAGCAAELLVMVRGHGWRPIPALQPPPTPRPAQGLPAEYLERKAALAARTETPERTPE